MSGDLDHASDGRGPQGPRRPRFASSGTISERRLSILEVAYDLESYPALGVDEFIDVLERSTLAERRPVEDRACIRGMLEHADIIVTARLEGLLVGISRAITDYNFCTYLSDLAVDQKYQKQGIGRALIRRTHEAAGLNTVLILLAAPLARSYYPHIGMLAHDSCWIIPRQPEAAS
jgi:GNAT superfamily N-acetyltransferase